MLLVALAICFTSVACHAQKIEFYDSVDMPTLSTDCLYFKSGEFSVSTGWTDTVKTFYCKTKKIRSREFYNLGMKEGVGLYYYPNGKIKEKIIYRNNKPVGIVTQYYSNGKAKYTKIFVSPGQLAMKNPFNYLIINAWDSTGLATIKNYQGYFKDELEQGKIKNGLRDSVWITFDRMGRKTLIETYKEGEFIAGDRYAQGQTIHFNTFETTASPSGGLENLYQFIGRHLRYPEEARRKGIEGKVFVQFVVEADGSLSNILIKNGFNVDCDLEALRVARLFKPWNPAIQRGAPIRQSFTMPFVFKLAK